MSLLKDSMEGGEDREEREDVPEGGGRVGALSSMLHGCRVFS